MSDETMRAGANPASDLEADISRMRELLLGMVQDGGNKEHSLERRATCMTLAVRLFNATVGASATLARLRTSDLAYRDFVERQQSLAGKRRKFTAEELAERKRLMDEVAAKLSALEKSQDEADASKLEK